MLVDRDLMRRNYGSPDLVDDYVTVPEGRIHFVKKGSGPPVILLHPLGTATWVWDGTMEILSQNYTCYAFDALGHGLSDNPGRENYSVPDYARAMDHAMQVLNLHRVHVIGNSFGAIQTVQLAASYPDRVDKMVVVGLPVWDIRSAPLLLENIATMAGFDENGIPTTRTLEDEKGGGAFAHPTQDMVDRNNASRDQAGIWMSKTLTALAWFDIVSLLPKIKATASLVVYGEQDFLRELAEDILRYNLPNCSKVILPNLGHIPQVEDPESFTTPILKFLKKGPIYQHSGNQSVTRRFTPHQLSPVKGGENKLVLPRQGKTGKRVECPTNFGDDYQPKANTWPSDGLIKEHGVKLPLVRLGYLALDLLFPAQCFGCGKYGRFLCPDCEASSLRLKRPFCDL